MSVAHDYYRVEQAIDLIARRPARSKAVAESFDSIEGLWGQGRLSLEQRFRLLARLVRSTRPSSVDPMAEIPAGTRPIIPHGPRALSMPDPEGFRRPRM